jgi:hypothetical protein
MVAEIILPSLGVTLEEEKHIYSLPNGTHPPAVSDIIRFMSRDLYDGIPESSLEVAAKKGRFVHKQTYWLDTCGYTDEEEGTAPYMAAYRIWNDDREKEFKPVWIAREWMAYHRSLLYAGTVDGIGYLTPPDGNGVDLLDLKTTTKYHGVMLATQVAGGYKEMVESWGIKVRDCYGLCLLPDQKPVYRFEKLDPKRGKLWFLNCLSLHNAMALEERP